MSSWPSSEEVGEGGGERGGEGRGEGGGRLCFETCSWKRVFGISCTLQVINDP